MALTPVLTEPQREGVVHIDEARRQLIGVRTEAVVSAPMQRVVRAVGRIAYDESGLTDVSPKVRGWIGKLFVRATGQRVARGQALFTLYSPELYEAEQDFVLALHGAADDGGPTSPLARAARQRLHLLGLDAAQIDGLARSGRPPEEVTITAPASGFVVEKDAVEGGAVEAGARVLRIASLRKVWVEADVYEADLPGTRAGQRATIALDAVPGRTYEAAVAAVVPAVDAATRTARVRLELPNDGLELRPGMYATVTLASDLGTRVQVPAGAVVYTGPRRLVFVDLGQGRFKPVEIQVGAETNGAYEVLSGLAAGDVVATSGVFLIAAEARIATAAKYWDPAPEASP
jgi:Cu(I)/Ag(I) efflux system membrane fusion protein